MDALKLRDWGYVCWGRNQDGELTGSPAERPPGADAVLDTVIPGAADDGAAPRT